MLFILFLVVVAALVILYHAAVFAVIAAVFVFVTHLLWLTYIKDHPLQIALYVAGYFLSGAVWSVIKWWFHETARVRDAKAEYAKYHVGKKTWSEFAEAYKKQAPRYHDDIKWWITLWPLNFLWTLLDDPIRRIARRIYEELRGVYDRITEYVWRAPDYRL